jgi:chromate transporter
VGGKVKFIAATIVKQLYYLFRTFLLIGATSFGGYLALVAMMRNKMVMRDQSIDDDLIAEGISLASMLPGPVAVNVVAYTGYHKAGVPGALVSIIAVLAPSYFLVLFLTVLYSRAGEDIPIESILLGVFPVVAGIILSTGISMGRKICSHWLHYFISCAALVLLFFFKSYWVILVVLFAAALLGVVLLKVETKHEGEVSLRDSKPTVIALVIYGLVITAVILLSGNTMVGKIVEYFTSVSLTLFGGGYVMIPVLKNMLVDQLGWFNNEEFVYGISIGQVTPGPILISSVFFGYKVGGVVGSIAAMVAIFFPSALLMIILSSIYRAFKNNGYIQSALQGVKPAVVGMILYAAISIFIEHTHNANLLISLSLALISFALVFRFNVTNALVILAGGVLGVLLY